MKDPGWPHGNRPPHRIAWELWKPGRVMSCEINAHPLGYELRIYMRGTFITGQSFPTLEQTETDAEERKKQALAEGWMVRPPMVE